MTTSYCSRLASVKAPPSSVTVTVKLLAVPSCWMAVVASSMLVCRKAAVLEKTSASKESAAAAAEAADLALSAVHGTASARGVGALVSVAVVLSAASDVSEVVLAVVGAGLGAAALAVPAMPDGRAQWQRHEHGHGRAEECA